MRAGCSPFRMARAMLDVVVGCFGALAMRSQAAACSSSMVRRYRRLLAILVISWSARHPRAA
jgi:hypothetical protein